MNRKFKYRFILIILLVINWQGNPLPGQFVKSDDEDFVFRSMILPGSLNTWETRTSLSVIFTHLPYDWVEIAVEVPLFQINNKIMLPAGFTLESHFQSIIVSNQLRVGPHFYYDIGKITLGAGFDNEFMFGKMLIAGFNSKSWGWGMYPNFMSGFRIRDIAITLNAELSFINSLKMSSGNEEISHSGKMFSGFSVSVFTEQRLWDDHMMIFGLINNFQKIYFPAWPAFTNFTRQYYIPQLYIGLVL